MRSHLPSDNTLPSAVSYSCYPQLLNASHKATICLVTPPVTACNNVREITVMMTVMGALPAGPGSAHELRSKWRVPNGLLSVLHYFHSSLASRRLAGQMEATHGGSTLHSTNWGI
jgi:hypothetical protein